MGRQCTKGRTSATQDRQHILGTWRRESHLAPVLTGQEHGPCRAGPCASRREERKARRGLDTSSRAQVEDGARAHGLRRAKSLSEGRNDTQHIGRRLVQVFENDPHAGAYGACQGAFDKLKRAWPRGARYVRADQRFRIDA